MPIETRVDAICGCCGPRAFLWLTTIFSRAVTRDFSPGDARVAPADAPALGIFPIAGLGRDLRGRGAGLGADVTDILTTGNPGFRFVASGVPATDCVFDNGNVDADGVLPDCVNPTPSGE